MLHQLYIPREGDQEIISEYILDLEVLSDEKLKEKAEIAAQQGIFGVHRQALYLTALHAVLRDRKISSPVHIDSNNIITVDKKG